MVNISFLGSCREVGRSAILIESSKGDKCLLDYGVRFSEKSRMPVQVDLSNLKACALTHCHIDHSGALPFLYKKHKRLPFFTNALTLEIVDKLINDMLKVTSYPYPFGKAEINSLKENSVLLDVGVKQKIADDFFITFYNAGHVPGSVSILVEVDGKRILYTGDINTNPTNLINSANPKNIPKIDCAIIESTYALRDHSPRIETEKAFTEEVINITDNGGRVLIPAFSVARSQEVFMILEKFNYKKPLFLDGMATLISKIYLDHPYSLQDRNLYRKALSKVNFVNRRRKRAKAKNTNGTIISPSGMVKGGSVLNYIKSFLKDPTSAIFLVGYQVEGTPGRGLLDNNIFKFKEKNEHRKTDYNYNIKAKCKVASYDFSSHSDGKGLHNYVEELNFTDNAKEIFCVHGDNKATTTFAGELADKGYTSVAPESGEVYRI
ncbi:MAG: MBL fold metallo-hydrolase [Promethearchaeota archaeon]|nr:MAG: MBL fold metallo-hydrolase [Candidatus Lokiarchaeota archaeon]